MIFSSFAGKNREFLDWLWSWKMMLEGRGMAEWRKSLPALVTILRKA